MIPPAPDHIEEYFLNKDGIKEIILSKELFSVPELDNVDLRTELGFEELIIINKLIMMDSVLLSFNDSLPSHLIKFKSPFLSYVRQHMRLKISKDRKSREEFVDINRQQDFNDNLKKISNFKNILDSKS